MPQQVYRLGVAFALVLAAVVTARYFLVPETFGEFFAARHGDNRLDRRVAALLGGPATAGGHEGLCAIFIGQVEQWL